jgi:hypothetical protein
MGDIAREVLVQHWVHSHEEDTPGQKVFRPAAHPLPPSRGRLSFDLRSNGDLVHYGIGPTDRTQGAPGVWSYDGARLVLRSQPDKDPDQVLEIVSVRPDQLIVRK